MLRWQSTHTTNKLTVTDSPQHEPRRSSDPHGSSPTLLLHTFSQPEMMMHQDERCSDEMVDTATEPYCLSSVILSRSVPERISQSHQHSTTATNSLLLHVTSYDESSHCSSISAGTLSSSPVAFCSIHSSRQSRGRHREQQRQRRRSEHQPLTAISSSMLSFNTRLICIVNAA